MELGALLTASAATDEFRTDTIALATGGSAPRISLTRRAPAIKVLRVIAQLLSAEPTLRIVRVHIDARSGCADYTGRIDVHTATLTHHFEFSWDCQWRAEEQGWTDDFGFPDQIRAAQEFGWRCFRLWRPTGTSSASHPPALAS